MAGNTTALLEPIAARIAGLGIGVSYDRDGRYTADQTGVYMKVSAEKPDRIVTLNAVWNDSNPSMPLDHVMVQVRGRGLPGQPLDVDDLLDAISADLDGVTNWDLGEGLYVNQMLRKVTVPMGMDDTKRWERVDQYYLDLDVPPTINRPAGGAW